MILEAVTNNCDNVLDSNGHVQTEPFLSTCDHVLPFIGVIMPTCRNSAASLQEQQGGVVYTAGFIAAPPLNVDEFM